MEHSGFSHFTAGTAFGNAPSVALLEKLGFRCVRKEQMTFRKDEHGKDIVCECGIYDLMGGMKSDQSSVGLHDFLSYSDLP